MCTATITATPVDLERTIRDRGFVRPLTTSTELITPLRVQWSLRVAFAIVFCWFGGLKIVDNSPAHDLVEATLQWTQIDSISHLLGMWEVVIASCFLIPSITRFTLAMFLVHMAGTFCAAHYATRAVVYLVSTWVVAYRTIHP